MKIELMDQPILIIKSAPPVQAFPSGKETLQQLEDLLEEEIDQIRGKLDSDVEVILSDYFTEFNLHFQTDKEVVSIVLESEWQDQMEEEAAEEVLSDTTTATSDSLIDLKVSELMRAVKVSYEDGGVKLKEKKKILSWIIDQPEDIPFFSGLGNCDYLLLSAKTIVTSISKLKGHLSLD